MTKLKGNESISQPVLHDPDISEGGQCRRATKITYWVTTGLLAGMSAFAGFTYLSGSPQTVQEFAHVAYPQQLRVLLGIAKLLGAIVLVVPGIARVKEWAYAGFAFAWIAAFVAQDAAHVAGAPRHLLSDPAGQSSVSG